MPIYEFKCQNCGNIEEVIMKVTDPHPVKCLACGADKLEKMMSKTNFVLKGQGWYETDFKENKSNNTSSSADKKAPEKAHSTTNENDKPSAKSETQSDTTTKSPIKSKSSGKKTKETAKAAE